MVDKGYRYKFDNFDKDLLLSTELLVELLRLDDEDIERKIRTIEWYITIIKTIYKIEDSCKIRFKEGDLFGGGCYISSTNEIRLYGSISPITILHEIRHYIQQYRKELTIRNKEYDARCWSCSLLYQVDKEYFEELMKENKLDFY